ncbi:hypothetical protein D9611_011791 [Ephemerocybe angulata]|uniref:F-box domain-containing protein n=1 Tax=Ephemerocybe angulata TaxID=980116 RepID=A0A8H5C5W4_9AGAR|nr:hypothetical protein D9611_011791 [Tulosesus angulatus]
MEQAPISELSAEILLQIFRATLQGPFPPDLSQILNLFGVCSTWREILRGESRLWTNVAIRRRQSEGDTYKGVAFVKRWSKPHLLRLLLDCNTTMRLRDIIPVERLGSLTLHGVVPQQFFSIYDVRFPLLTRLCITMDDRDAWQVNAFRPEGVRAFPRPITAFSNCPMLVEVSIRGPIAGPGANEMFILPWEQLTSVFIGYVYHTHLPLFTDVIAHLQQAAVLAFHASFAHNTHGVIDPNGAVPLPNLTTLHLTSHGRFTALLRAASFPNLTTLYLVDDLSNIQLIERFISPFLQALPNLRCLGIRCDPMIPAPAAVELLRSASQITRLEVRSANSQVPLLQSLQQLAVLPDLRVLSVDSPAAETADLAACIQARLGAGALSLEVAWTPERPLPQGLAQIGQVMKIQPDRDDPDDHWIPRWMWCEGTVQ